MIHRKIDLKKENEEKERKDYLTGNVLVFLHDLAREKNFCRPAENI